MYIVLFQLNFSNKKNNNLHDVLIYSECPQT